MRNSLAKLDGGDTTNTEHDFYRNKQFGRFLKDKVFSPGAKKPWPEFVEEVTGKKLSAEDFAKEVK
jgi:hypothetical protein